MSKGIDQIEKNRERIKQLRKKKKNDIQADYPKVGVPFLRGSYMNLTL